MDITIQPGLLSGTIQAIPSKSQAHRILICAAFADSPTTIICPDTNQDIEATANCLRALGAEIHRTEVGYQVTPITAIPQTAVLNCNESGSTLRFMLPIVGALGTDAIFHMAGRLPQRPLSPLWEEMERMGCRLSRPSTDILRCQGQLSCGHYAIPGNVSSQFITGLLFAAALLSEKTKIEVIGHLESAPYVEMTQAAMALFGADTKGMQVNGPIKFHSPGEVTVEGDWSNGAFWLAANALGSNLTITNLRPDSPQGDKAVRSLLMALENSVTIDARDTPDLVPILAVTAGAKKGATFINCARLRLKETDRLLTTAAMIQNLGGKAQIQDDTLIVSGTGYCGGTVDATNDHRIVMSAAIAATVCDSPVTIINAQEVRKSYPAFWRDYEMLGGKI